MLNEIEQKLYNEALAELCRDFVELAEEVGMDESAEELEQYAQDYEAQAATLAKESATAETR